MIITITGRMGSGKNTFLKLLNIPADYTVIDADTIGHQLLQNPQVIKQIESHFPLAVLNGSIHRLRLAKLVFPDNIKKLNAIMHPAITKEIKNIMTDNTIINAALLEALQLKHISDKVIFINTAINIVIERLKDTFSKKDILNRLKTQKSIDWYNAQADITINNNGNLDDLKKEIDSKCQNIF